jgi:hypothetical protein
LEGRQHPAIREQAAEVGATIYFADEAAVRSDYHAGASWAPVGRHPGGRPSDAPLQRGQGVRRLERDASNTSAPADQDAKLRHHSPPQSAADGR